MLSTLPTSQALREKSRAARAQLIASTRIWLEDSRFIGKVFVRAEWATEYGPACTVGCARIDTHRRRVVIADLHWIYDAAPDEVDDLVRDILLSDAEHEHAAFVDYETSEQMDAAMESERYADYQTAMQAQWQAQRAAGAVR